MKRVTMRRIANALLLGLSGSVFVNCAAYGMPMIAHDASVVLEDFSYTPASPIHVGDTITFHAKLNHYADGAYLSVNAGQPGYFQTYLHDYGKMGDGKAGDGIYTSVVQWHAWNGSGSGIPISVDLWWDDGYTQQHLSAPPLTVLPAEEEGQ